MSALCMTASMAAALPVSAAEVKGDVDGDGYVTGHDAAVVSRYLHEGDVELTEAQLAIADVDGNGKVEQADADWMQENREYALGDSWLTGKKAGVDGCVWDYSLCAAYDALVSSSIEIVFNGEVPTKYQYTQTPLMQSLLDITADGKVTILDAYLFLLTDSLYAVGRDGWDTAYQNGRYYIDYSDPRLTGETKKGQNVGGMNGKDIIYDGEGDFVLVD